MIELTFIHDLLNITMAKWNQPIYIKRYALKIQLLESDIKLIHSFHKMVPNFVSSLALMSQKWNEDLPLTELFYKSNRPLEIAAKFRF